MDGVYRAEAGSFGGSEVDGGSFLRLAGRHGGGGQAYVRRGLIGENVAGVRAFGGEDPVKTGLGAGQVELGRDDVETTIPAGACVQQANEEGVADRVE